MDHSFYRWICGGKVDRKKETYLEGRFLLVHGGHRWVGARIDFFVLQLKPLRSYPL